MINRNKRDVLTPLKKRPDLNMDDQTTAKIENVLRNTDVKSKNVLFRLPKTVLFVPPILIALFLLLNSIFSTENHSAISGENASETLQTPFYFGNFLYIFGLILFMVGIGFIGAGLFFLFVKMERKQGVVSLLIGLSIVIGAMMLYENRPSYKGEALIVVENVSVYEHMGLNRCTVTAEETGIEYHFDSEFENTANDFCNAFEIGQEYKIQYEMVKAEYKLIGKLD
ncbi:MULTISPECIES: hypothetical protein [Sutcliffiella]|uniref:Uncharacterized protein n=1 Tax=Sutcliffiella cohnii TaxID=33932 RepID=A0A223KP45_9BACI|nr:MULTISPECIES: hypothetical protein [Sutcliffiella]AST91124.1 hypothetical protein BC6307_07445 [Sutcliffiella cohnii]WBL16924.1 hypothetical protein O1A01_09945 [Sutcliffiella sp. NC1]